MVVRSVDIVELPTSTEYPDATKVPSVDRAEFPKDVYVFVT